MSLFTYPNYLYELIFHSEYPEIVQLCKGNRAINQLCQNDSQISKLIQQKRIEYKTDRFMRGKGFNGFYVAIKNGDVEIVNELIRRGRNPSDSGNAAISTASGYSSLAMVNLLLSDSRVEPSANDNEAIRVASSKGQLSNVNRLLQDKRVNPTVNDNDAIKTAAYLGYDDIVYRLLQDPRVKSSLSVADLEPYLHNEMDPTIAKDIIRKLSAFDA